MNIQLIENAGVAVITAEPDFNPLHKLRDLSTELKSLQFSGAVVFDLFITNGVSDNRFVSIVFNGNGFDRKTFSVIKHIDPKIKEKQNLYIKAHPEFLQASILSLSEQKLFQR